MRAGIAEVVRISVKTETRVRCPSSRWKPLADRLRAGVALSAAPGDGGRAARRLLVLGDCIHSRQSLIRPGSIPHGPFQTATYSATARRARRGLGGNDRARRKAGGGGKTKSRLSGMYPLGAAPRRSRKPAQPVDRGSKNLFCPGGATAGPCMTCGFRNRDLIVGDDFRCPCRGKSIERHPYHGLRCGPRVMFRRFIWSWPNVVSS